MLLLIILSFCLNLSHAQNPLDDTAIKKVIDGIQSQVPVNTNPVPGPVVYPALPPPSAPTPNPAATAATAANSTAPVPAGTEILDPEKATSGKYEEYQSICRSHEYDNIAFKPLEVRQARIALLKRRAEGGTEEIRDHLPLLQEYVLQGDSKNFKALITELKNKKSTLQDNDLLNALIFLSNRNPRAAISTLMKALTEDEKNEKILKLLAEAYTADNNFYEASTIYEDLNKLHKGKYLVEQCEAMVSNSLNADGEKICIEAASRFPENPFPFLFTGVTHRERENIATASAFFKKSMKVKPTEMGATCLAETFFIQKKFTDAAEAFAQSLAVNPSSARATLGMAWAYLKAQNYEASLEAFRKACLLSTRFQPEIRKAFKFLKEEKIVNAKRFLELAETCGG